MRLRATFDLYFHLLRTQHSIEDVAVVIDRTTPTTALTTRIAWVSCYRETFGTLSSVRKHTGTDIPGRTYWDMFSDRPDTHVRERAVCGIPPHTVCLCVWGGRGPIRRYAPIR